LQFGLHREDAAAFDEAAIELYSAIRAHFQEVSTTASGNRAVLSPDHRHFWGKDDLAPLWITSELNLLNVVAKLQRLAGFLTAEKFNV
jgi:hypothetical protein